LLELPELFLRKFELFLGTFEGFVEVFLGPTFVKTFLAAAFVKGLNEVTVLFIRPRVVVPMLLTAPTAELKILAAVLVTVLFTELKVLFAAFPRLLIPGKPFIPMYH